jgi:hypothetical protein
VNDILKGVEVVKLYPKLNTKSFPIGYFVHQTISVLRVYKVIDGILIRHDIKVFMFSSLNQLHPLILIQNYVY